MAGVTGTDHRGTSKGTGQTLAHIVHGMGAIGGLRAQECHGQTCHKGITLVSVLRMGYKGPEQETSSKTQARDDGSPSQGGSLGSGEKSGSGYTVSLRRELSGFGG